MNQVAPKETACPDCGEMVRINSLRCWNCGGFMNSDLEQRYIAMQSSPRPVILSSAELEDDDQNDAEEVDDFELKTPVPRQVRIPEDSIAIADDIIRIAPSEPETPPTTENRPTEVSHDPSDIDGPPLASELTRDEKSKRLREQPAGDVAHSVATGGDALLEIAMNEERETRKRQKGKRVSGGMRTAGGGLIIFCPYGCKIEVKENHRGMTGRCPRCQAPFIVPIDPPIFKQTAPEGTTTDAAAGGQPASSFRIWLHDLRLHVVDPEKLKLKADSLAKEFIEVDVGFGPETLVVASLARKAAGGLFAKGGGGKKEEVRTALLEHLNEKKPLAELPVGDKYLFNAGDLSQLKVVQPAADRSSNIFHGIPVFGTHRIAVQLPLNEQTPHPVYLSMGITEFWKFRQAMEEVYQIAELDRDLGLPREVRFDQFKCHYTDTPIKALLDLELFRADPTVQLEVAGYQCGACKIVVSEAGRKKENLGGKSPKGIAKAKCPKCGNKMGEHLLYSLKQDIVDPSLS